MMCIICMQYVLIAVHCNNSAHVHTYQPWPAVLQCTCNVPPVLSLHLHYKPNKANHFVDRLDLTRGSYKANHFVDRLGLIRGSSAFVDRSICDKMVRSRCRSVWPYTKVVLCSAGPYSTETPYPLQSSTIIVITQPRFHF